jgi:hypothetical protein
MKTIREWLEELPEPYRTQAIANAYREDNFADENTLAETASRALDIAFIHLTSIEGLDYWTNIWEKLQDNESLDN